MKDDQKIISEIGNMHWHGWRPWPAKIPRQPGYEYSQFVGYDLKPMLYSRPGCSLLLRLKWLFRRKTQNANIPSAPSCSPAASPNVRHLLLQCAALLQTAHLQALAQNSNAVEEIVDARQCVEAALVSFGGPLGHQTDNMEVRGARQNEGR